MKIEFGDQFGITKSNGRMKDHPKISDNGQSLFNAYQKL